MRKNLFSFVLVVVALFSFAGIARAETFSTNLTLGSTGPDVTRLQSWLESGRFLTMPSGVAKGYFGQATKAALVKYQISAGIVPASGYFGPLTRTKIGSSTSVTNPLKVLSPKANRAEIWTKSKTYPIYWQGGRANAPTDIFLSVNPDLEICQSTPGAICPAVAFPPSIRIATSVAGPEYGAFHNWSPSEIPSLASGQWYYIKVCQFGSCAYADEPFTVSNENAITLTAPEAGESWKVRTRQTIRWNTSDDANVDFVRILVLGSRLTNCSVCSTPTPALQTDDVANRGTYRWQIPDDIDPGFFKLTIHAYRFDIEGQRVEVGTAQSGEFEIVAD